MAYGINKESISDFYYSIDLKCDQFLSCYGFVCCRLILIEAQERFYSDLCTECIVIFPSFCDFCAFSLVSISHVEVLLTAI
jgi:hypothetical protein